MKQSRSSLRVRLVCLGVAAALAAVTTAARAGFLDDFYSNSGSYQGNLTKPGVIESNTLNTITGGGFVYKTPRNQFSPFYFTPPSLKAGCGGIDTFAGAMSIPSQAEFLAFLRNIGQSLPGLAFELALQSMSPELAQQVATYKDMLMKLAQNSTDACTAASDLLKFTGADKKIREAVQDAENYGRSTGLFSDHAAAKKETGAHGQKAIDTVPIKVNPNGEVIDGPELNLVWAMLNNTQMAVAAPRELKQLMMSLTGTWIYRRDGNGADQVLRPEHYPSLMENFIDYIGTVDSATLELSKAKLYTCDEPTMCMTPTAGAYGDISFANRVYSAAIRYRDGIVTRNPALVDYDELYMIASHTSIPLLRIVNATAYNRYAGLGQSLIAIYAEAVAYELLLNYIEQLSIDTERAMATAKDNTLSKLISDNAVEIRSRLQNVRTAARQESQRIYQKMNTASSFISQVEHIERSLRGNLAADLAANMTFTARR